MTSQCITNVQLWDGDSETLQSATVMIKENRIQTIIRAPSVLPALPEDVIDAGGLTLMPGLIDGHCHPSFTGIDDPAELGRIPPEQHMVLTIANLKLLLEHGFTSIFEAASSKPLLGVTARDAIEQGLIAGPRMKAGSPEVTTSAGLGDASLRYIEQSSFGLVADGPIEMRKVARECVRDGVDILKVNISGDQFVPHAGAEITTIEEDELAAFTDVGRAFGRTLAAHARSSKSVKMAVKHGIDCIYHCDFADEEALDMLESVKDKIFTGPAFGLVHNCVKDPELGLPEEDCLAMDLYRKFDSCCATYQEIRKRGIRVVVGGDYGFGITPMGQNARDIAHFVNYFGYTPLQALQCATQTGAELLGMEDKIGKIREGYLADMILVRGNPLEDITILQDKDNIALVMKDGVIYKNLL